MIDEEPTMMIERVKFDFRAVNFDFHWQRAPQKQL